MLAGSQTMRTNAVAARKAVFGDPRTLYGRGGGVFGLARLVDKLMDAWMDKTVSPTLNDNTKVAPLNYHIKNTTSNQQTDPTFNYTHHLPYHHRSHPRRLRRLLTPPSEETGDAMITSKRRRRRATR